ncbi:hypothetical protein ACMGE6_04100 [Macrococcus equi]
MREVVFILLTALIRDAFNAALLDLALELVELLELLVVEPPLVPPASVE